MFLFDVKEFLKCCEVQHFLVYACGHQTVRPRDFSGALRSIPAVSTGCGLMIKYKELSLEALWISITEEHESIPKKALAILLQSSTSYL